MVGLLKRGIDLNVLANKVAQMEAGNRQADIAQIKEIIKDTLIILNDYPVWKILEAIDRTARRYQ